MSAVGNTGREDPLDACGMGCPGPAGLRGRRHAFALVKALAADGELGRIWSVPTPVVYRAVNTLRDTGLIEAIGEERSDAGPPRTLPGHHTRRQAALEVWLRTPVAHMREVRGELLLKLALLASMRESAAQLVKAQLRIFAPIMEGLEAQASRDDREGNFDLTLARWRLENARAVMRFLAELAEHP